jgi:Protein of unknown function (DUF664)
MTSGTNLLGLVEHLAGAEASYLGDCLGRPAPFRLPWVDDGSIWDSADMWATAEESRESRRTGTERPPCRRWDLRPSPFASVRW